MGKLNQNSRKNKDIEVNKSERWIECAKDALELLLQRPSGTAFDRHLFGKDVFVKMICEEDILFPDEVEKELKIIRAQRLKFLGYKWKGNDIGWRHS